MDTSLFIYHTQEGNLWILVYVVDIIITGSKFFLIEVFIQKLNSQFSVKDLGPLSFSMGIEAVQDSTGL